MSDLLIPAAAHHDNPVRPTDRLLDGWVGPVTSRFDGEGDEPWASFGLQDADGDWLVHPGSGNLRWVPLAALRLALSRAEVYARVVTRLGLLEGHARAAMWHRSRTFWSNGVKAWGYQYPTPSVDYPGSEVVCTRVFASAPDWSRGACVVPALAALDPDDNTRLPNGLLRVDLLALRVVWLGLGGKP